MSQNLQPLGQIVAPSSFPKEIEFMATPIASILNNFLVVEYFSQSSAEFNTVSVYMVLRTTEDLSFEIPGTGFSLILNPGITPPGEPTATDFPISVHVNFKDQGLWQEFDLVNFSNGYRDVYDRLIDYFDLSEEYIIERVLTLNYTDSNAMIAAINSQYPSASLSNINLADPISAQVDAI